MIINKQIKKKKVPSAHFLIASIHHHSIPHLCPRHNTPSTDLVVGVTSEESLSVSAPSQGNTLGLTALLALLDVLGLELVDLALLLEVEDGDAGGGGSAEPVAVGGEDEGVDLIASVERVEVLGLVKIPEHGGTVLATGGAERAVGGDGDGVDVAGVTDVVGLETAGSELPNLDKLVPASGDDDGVLGVGAEAHARNPLGVALVGDGVLAVTQGVPELDGTVTRTGDNLAVVGGERDGKDVVVVADESAGSGTAGELPETERLVPRGGESVGTVRGDHTVRDDVRVTLEAALGVTVGLLVAGKVPDDQGLVATAREQHVGVLQRGSQGSNPAIVTLEGAAKDQLLSHDRSLGDDEGTARGERRRMNAGGAIVVDSLGLG
jgi:hypothetical protein